MRWALLFYLRNFFLVFLSWVLLTCRFVYISSVRINCHISYYSFMLRFDQNHQAWAREDGIIMRPWPWVNVGVGYIVHVWLCFHIGQQLSRKDGHNMGKLRLTRTHKDEMDPCWSITALKPPTSVMWWRHLHPKLPTSLAGALACHVGACHVGATTAPHVTQTFRAETRLLLHF